MELYENYCQRCPRPGRVAPGQEFLPDPKKCHLCSANTDREILVAYLENDREILKLRADKAKAAAGIRYHTGIQHGYHKRLADVNCKGVRIIKVGDQAIMLDASGGNLHITHARLERL